ncbi:AzlC family ABC transporter permease [Rhizobium alvei]|uniref:AzlC family ABC transporter permease n=1 Tax=Rhizobium alvei TaxID=1132659 RepID=A0ABT8YIJ8_9HYPH|nr:AzlC family ABC transporter permease [Rhizobium alvei]MDO6963492.1 AzlC family ABC transporter permease [Rhizobium alvei]
MNRDEILSGIRTALPILLGALPFGVLFGAVATGMGISTGETVLMSMTIYAGASQLVGIELFQHHVAPWLVVLSVFAVNFRHVLYSAALANHIDHFSFGQKVIAFFLLVDPQFAESLKRGESGIKVTFVWYMAFGLTFYICWNFAAFLGAIFGKFVGDPKALGLDVLLTVYFLGLVLAFRKKDHWLPTVAVSSAAAIAAYHFVGSPWHVSIGALAGIAVAALLPVKTRETV